VSAATKSTVAIRVKITDSASVEPTAARRPQYVSPSIDGLLAQVYVSPQSSNPNVVGTSATDVSPGSAACGGQTGTRTCTITVPAPVGTDDFVFTAYNMPPVGNSFAGAATLSVGSVIAAPIVANASNTITVALSGVISSLSVSAMAFSPLSSSVTSYPLALSALDAGGNTIVAGASDPYENPITVSVQESGGSGFTFVSLNGGANSPSVSVTQSSQTVSVNYISGSPSGYSASVTESASGVTPIAALSITPVYTPPSASTTITIPASSSSGEIYVVDGLSNSITVYPPNPTGTLNESPVATISGSNTQLNHPYALALDSAGKIYVANSNSSSITVYAANPTGTVNESPVAIITGSNTGLAGPLGVALDAAGNIYVSNTASISVFPANPSGTLNESPLATITSSNMSGVWAIALDTSGRIYVTDDGNNSVLVFPANPSGTVNESPLAIISGSNTGLSYPSGLALDASGNIYVGNGNGAGTVTVYPANPSGTLNESPLATIAGGNTGLYTPYGLAFDASGKLYVADTDYVHVVVFAANPMGTINEVPLATISGSNTSLNAPIGIVVH
jgi:sugar lactone lactonase YvrE